MTSFTWTASAGGDWATAIDWNTDAVPDDSAAVVVIASASTSYVVQIGTADSETINNLTIGSENGTNGPTLDVDGTLQFAGTGAGSAFLRGGLVVGSSGLIDGSGDLGTSFINGVSFNLQNFGTIDANGGSGSPLIVLSALSNSGTLISNNATGGSALLIEGTSFANISGTTLTGGSYIVSGPAFGSDDEIEFGVNFTADIVTDAATIVLSGAATDITGYVGGQFQSLEQQLQTIAANGTLALLGRRGYSTANTLTDAGSLLFQGGTLSTGGLSVTGTLDGYGVIATGIGNQGAVIASGGTLGALAIDGSVTGTGTLTVDAGSSMIVDGGSIASVSIAAGGTLFDHGSLTITGAAAGTGMISVEGGGGALEIAGAASLDINFSGTNVAVTLAAPGQYSGTLTGIGLGNTLVLDGIQGTTATVVNTNTLLVLSGSTTLDTIALAGSYAGASFIASTVGTTTVVQNTAGAPVRDDMPIVLANGTVTNNAGLSATLVNEIEADLTAAAENWGQYITGAIPLRVSLTIDSAGSNGNELAQGSPGDLISTGQTVDGHLLYEPNSDYALATGSYASGTTSDVNITLFATATNLANFDLDANQADPVPGNQYDLVSILTHEFAHGLGFIGLVNTTNPTPGSPPVAAGAEISTYDQFITTTIVSGSTLAFFDGPNAEAAYGASLGTNTPTPVPLTLISGDPENFYHFANSTTDPLGKDLMSGIGLGTGTAVAISAVDLAVLADIGVPVTANVVCYARGTRIATPAGEVAIESLRVGDNVQTASGSSVPIIWIGRRHVDCRRHPAPDKVQPVRIRAEAFGSGQPRRDLLVSPQHAIFFAGVLIPARLLANGITVTQLEVETVDYFHIELPWHDLLLAEGLPAESYLDSGDRQSFDNGGRIVALHPDFATRAWECSACAELKLIGPELEAARRHLHARSVELERTAAARKGGTTRWGGHQPLLRHGRAHP